MIFLEIPESIRTLSSELSILRKKKVWKRAKIFLLPGQAKIAPPVSSTLGQFGINLIYFCEKFNTVTKNLDQEIPLSVSVLVFSDKTFRFKVKPISLNELCFSFSTSSLLLKNYYLIDEKKEDFFISLYKIYLCFYFQSRILGSRSLSTKEEDSSKIIKLLISYLKSYRHNHKKNL